MLSIRHQSSLTRVNHTVRQGIKMRLEVKRNNLVSTELKVQRPRIFHHDQVQVKRQLQSFPRSSELKVQNSNQIQVRRRQLHSFPPPTSPSGEQGEVEALAHKDMAVRWIGSSLSELSSWIRPSPSSPSISTIVITITTRWDFASGQFSWSQDDGLSRAAATVERRAQLAPDAVIVHHHHHHHHR